jgi:hypothetical protein
MRPRFHLLLNFVIPGLIVFASVVPASAASLHKEDAGYQTGFIRWRGADGGFANWEKTGVKLTKVGTLTLDLRNAVSETDLYPAGGYYGGNYYNGGSFKVGEVNSPVLETTFGFKEAIASWNADTPVGTWIEIQIRAQTAGNWTKWYNLGIWASGEDTIKRHSVKLQGDADGYVATDTLVLSEKIVPADAFQLKARLFSTGSATPTIHNLSLAYSTAAPKKVDEVSAGNPALWNTLVDVPECSQMVYPDGGNVWCSPTSTSMVLGYYGFMSGPCEPRVRATVTGVYDWIYDGHGNWPFNTAYAASQGYEAYVARFTSLSGLEPWIKSGVPVIMSVAWGKNDLTNATVDSTAGHLIVLVGFDGSGNAIVNDPAADSNEGVRRTYLRSELEPLWLQNSGGTVYLIYPVGVAVPGL